MTKEGGHYVIAEDTVKLRILIACVLSLTAAGLIGAVPSDSSGLIVHEWGTFLAMNGSDGVSLDGMYHEEHALPSFVHARSRDQPRLPMSRRMASRIRCSAPDSRWPFRCPRGIDALPTHMPDPAARR